MNVKPVGGAAVATGGARIDVPLDDVVKAGVCRAIPALPPPPVAPSWPPIHLSAAFAPTLILRRVKRAGVTCMETGAGPGCAVRVHALLLHALGILAAVVPNSDASVPFPAQTRASGAGAAVRGAAAAAAAAAAAEEEAAGAGRQRRRGVG